jgi:putative protease
MSLIHNGDGLTFFIFLGELEGFRVNRVESNRIYPQNMPHFNVNTCLYRNYDHQFESLLSKPSAERKIGVVIEWGDFPEGFTLTMTDETDVRVVITRLFPKDIARQSQAETIRIQLGKLGNTPFKATKIISTMSDDYFIPSSLLNGMRQAATERLMALRRIRYRRTCRLPDVYDKEISYPLQKLDFKANVSNKKAEAFYKKHHAEVIEPALEVCKLKYKLKSKKDIAGIESIELYLHEKAPLMVTKHCLRFSMGWCSVHQKTESSNREPFYLIYKEIRFRLFFDCKKCRMLVFLSQEK